MASIALIVCIITEWRGYLLEGKTWDAFKAAIDQTKAAKIYKEKSFYAEEAEICNFFPGLEGKNCKYCRICEYRKKEGGVDECNGASKPGMMSALLVMSFLSAATTVVMILFPLSI
jgi:hypothetical protein